MRKAVLLVTAVAYLALLNREFTSDGVTYAVSARDGYALYHPHHLLYNMGARQLHHLFARVDLWTLLSIVSALWSLLNVAWLYALARRVFGSDARAAFIACFYAFSDVTWFLGTTAEVYPMVTTFELWAFDRMWRAERACSNREAVVLGVLTALAMLMHQTAIFFALALAWWLWSTTRSLARTAIYLGVSGAITGGAYLLAAWHEGVTGVSSFVRWLVLYAHSEQFKSGEWGGGLSLGRILNPLSGSIESFISFGPLHRWTRGDHPVWTVWTVLEGVSLLVGACALVAWMVRRAPPEPARVRVPPPLRRLLVVWLVLHGAFTIWWDGGSREIWSMLIAPLLLVIAWRPRVRPAEWVLLGALVAANLFGGLIPDSRDENGPVYPVVEQLGCDNLRDGDVIIGGVSELDHYVRYRCKVTIRQLPAGTPDPPNARVFHVAPSPPRGWRVWR
jgi:hypothetical protein